jgi:hypothetical protein
MLFEIDAAGEADRMRIPRLQVESTSGGSGGSGGGPICFMAGTRIAASEGKISVDDLSVGSLVLTASGEPRPVRWLGHRTTGKNRWLRQSR